MTNVAGVNPNAGFAASIQTSGQSYQWNLTISQLFKDTVFEASYIGNHGLHIWRRNVNRNDIPDNQPCRGSVRRQQRFGPPANRSRRNERREPGVGVQNQGTLIADNRVLRNVGNITTDESNGNSSYHAMQLCQSPLQQAPRVPGCIHLGTRFQTSR